MSDDSLEVKPTDFLMEALTGFDPAWFPARKTLTDYLKEHASRDGQFARDFAKKNNEEYRERERLQRMSPGEQDLYHMLKDLQAAVARLEAHINPPPAEPKINYPEFPDLYLEATRDVSA